MVDRSTRARSSSRDPEPARDPRPARDPLSDPLSPDELIPLDQPAPVSFPPPTPPVASRPSSAQRVPSRRVDISPAAASIGTRPPTRGRSRHSAVPADESPTTAIQASPQALRAERGAWTVHGDDAAVTPATTVPPTTTVPPITPEPEAPLTESPPESPTVPATEDEAVPTPGSAPSPATRSAITVTGLHKRFGDKVAVADVSFSVPEGTVLGLLGPNGAGKTTTVNMLCTLLKPDGGTAVIAGHDVAADPSGVRRSIMLTGQFAALDEALSGRENLILFGRLMGLSKSDARIRADELLTAFDLTDAGARRVREYSGGMRRRIDIASGLVTRPAVVFLDEPTTGLDPRSRQEVWNLVKELRRQGVTTLLTTQYLEEADELADHIVVIDAGRVIASGTVDELKAATGASHYRVTPADPADVERLAECLADLDPHAQIRLETDDEEPPAVAVPAAGNADTLVAIVKRTSEADIPLADVALRRPTLDEVFLALTAPGATIGDSPGDTTS